MASAAALLDAFGGARVINLPDPSALAALGESSAAGGSCRALAPG